MAATNDTSPEDCPGHVMEPLIDRAIPPGIWRCSVCWTIEDRGEPDDDWPVAPDDRPL